MGRIANNASDLSGQRFGMLVALERCGNRNGKIALWKCMCDCGNECIVYASSLKRGLTKSCGCYRNTFLKKHNEAIDKGDYVAIIANEKHILIDKEDYNTVKDVCWCVDSNGYVSGRLNGKKVLLHRIITKCDNEHCVDHIDHDPLNNRKTNLRICTIADNCKNKKTLSNNTSGVNGVCWVKSRKRWMAYIMIGGKNHTIGLYKDKKDAIYARLYEESKLFGEFMSEDDKELLAKINAQKCADWLNAHWKGYDHE